MAFFSRLSIDGRHVYARRPKFAFCNLILSPLAVLYASLFSNYLPCILPCRTCWGDSSNRCFSLEIQCQWLFVIAIPSNSSIGSIICLSAWSSVEPLASLSAMKSPHCALVQSGCCLIGPWAFTCARVMSGRSCKRCKMVWYYGNLGFLAMDRNFVGCLETSRASTKSVWIVPFILWRAMRSMVKMIMFNSVDEGRVSCSMVPSSTVMVTL